jgi:hypothetical protein
MIDLGITGNYIGSDGFIWWIGKVVNVNRTIETGSGSGDLYYHRAQVRIVGWHTEDKTKLPDEDLPWANILMPATESSGVNKVGKLHQLQDGEIVLGFFIDGKDGQQPVIVGSFFSQKALEYGTVQENIIDGFARPLPPQQVASGTSQDNVGRQQLVTPQKCEFLYSPDALGGLAFAPTSDGSYGAFSAEALANATFTTASGFKIPSSIPQSGFGVPTNTGCEISVALGNFNDDIKAAKTCIKTSATAASINSVKQGIDQFIQFFNSIQKDINSWTNDRKQFLSDVEAFIRNISKLISNFFADAISFVKDRVLFDISREVKNFISFVPEDQRPALSEEIRILVDLLDCTFDEIIDFLIDLIAEILTPLIGAVAQSAKCLYDNFIANVLSNIISLIQDKIGAVLGLINTLIGGVVNVAGILSSALQTILEFVEGCEQKKQITDNSCYDAKNKTSTSSIFSVVGSLSRLADIPNVGVQLFNQAQATANGLLGPITLGPIADINTCLPNFLQFGPPIITISNGAQNSLDDNRYGSSPGNRTGTGGTGIGTGGTGTGGVGTAKTCSFTIIPVIKNGQVIGGITQGDACGCTEDITINVQSEIGQGAVLRVIVNKDCQSDRCVQDVVVLNPGSGYLDQYYRQQVYELDDKGIFPKNFNLETYSNLKCLRDRIKDRLDAIQALEPDAKAVGGDSVDLISVLDKIVILNPGAGYCPDNTITVFDGDKEVCSNIPIKVGPRGEIVSIEGTCKVPVNSVPRVVINNPCGALAELKPVLDFKDPNTIQVPGANDKIVSVVLCSR